MEESFSSKNNNRPGRSSGVRNFGGALIRDTIIYLNYDRGIDIFSLSVGLYSFRLMKNLSDKIMLSTARPQINHLAGFFICKI